MMDSSEFLLQVIRDNRHTLEYIRNLLAFKDVSLNFANPVNQQTASILWQDMEMLNL